VHGRIEYISMRVAAQERCADKNASESRAEPNERGQSEHLPGFQHWLAVKRRSRSVGLIERERPGLHGNGRSRCRHANGGADQEDEGADAGDSAIDASPGSVSRPRVDTGPDIILQLVQWRIDVHPAQRGKLAIKLGQGSLRRSRSLIRARRRTPWLELAHRAAAAQE
jgi:hypothetical protein